MTSRVSVQQLHRYADELIDQVAAGERVEVIRDGRPVAVLGPPDPEQRLVEDLVRTGAVNPGNAASACGLGDWQPLSARPGAPAGLSEVLRQVHGEEER